MTRCPPHHWIIEPANGRKSRGVCRDCPATKEFWNSLPPSRLLANLGNGYGRMTGAQKAAMLLEEVEDPREDHVLQEIGEDY